MDASGQVFVVEDGRGLERSEEALVAAIGEVDWSAATSEQVAALGEVLARHEAHAGSVTEAHREAWRHLKKAGRAQLQLNTPHTTELVSWGLSCDGRVLATGAWTGGGAEVPGNIALWDVATGRCLRTIDDVYGGVGWPDNGGCLQWEPGGRLGVAYNTNGVGHLDPFADDWIRYCEYPTDGWGSPPGWCWAPDAVRLFVACYWRSKEPGCVVNPTDNSGTVSMRKAEGEPDIYAPKRLRWHAASNTVVGISRYHRQACAFDITKRERIWLHTAARESALSPDGSTVAICEGGQLALFDGPTGDTRPIDTIKGGRIMAFSPDSARLAVADRESVRIVREGALECELPVVADALGTWNTVDLEPLAFSPDSELLAVLSGNPHKATATVWRLGATPELVAEVDVSGCRGVFFGDGVVIAASKELLIFADADSGEVIAHNALYDNPASDPFDGELFEDDEAGLAFMTPFPDGAPERWGYLFKGRDVVVATHPDRVHAVADRRLVWPLAWSGAAVEPDLATAIQRHPDGFPAELVAAYRDAPKTKPKRQLPFPLENEATPDDLVSFVLGVLETSEPNRDQRRYQAEIAIHYTRTGRHDEAFALLDGLYVGRYPSHVPPKVLAYMAKSGADHRAVTSRLRTAEEGLEHAHASGKASIAAWCAAVRGVLGDSERAEALWASAMRDLGTDPDKTVEVAVALAFAGRAERALGLIKPSRFRTEHYHQILACVIEQGDLGLLDRYLALLDGEHFLASVHSRGAIARACRDAGVPERAWDMAERFAKVNTQGLIEQVAGYVRDRHGPERVRAYLQARIERAIDEDRIREHSRMIEIWVKQLGDDALGPHAQTFMHRISWDRLKRSREDVCRAVCQLACWGDDADSAVEFYRKFSIPDGLDWIMLLELLEPDHASRAEALGRALKYKHLSGRTFAMQRILTAIRDDEALYQKTVQRLMKAAGRDRLDLQYLCKALVMSGDLVNANMARMKIEKSIRYIATSEMGRAALEVGHFSAGIALLSTLEPGYGGHSSTYEAMRALIDDVWCWSFRA